VIRDRGALKRLILAGLEGVLGPGILVALLFGASGSALLAAPAVAQEPGPGEPDPIEAGLAPTSLPYAPGIDVLHYDFELALPETGESFLGRAQVRLALLQPLPEVIALDLTGLAVDDVRIDGRDAPFELSGGQLRIARPAERTRGELTVDIRYHGTPDDGLILQNTLHGRPGIFADNWPNRARFWLPTVDHPSDKATVRFTVHAPEAWQVVANGRLVQEPFATMGDALGESANRRTWIWEAGVPISPYNMVIGATEFVVELVGTAACGLAPLATRTDGCIEVTYWVFAPDVENASRKFARAAQMVDFFAQTIGPYPFEKLANVQSSTRFGGMENASAIFYSERGIANNTTDGVVAHEIAHQWFGDAVTEAKWSHLWLSEGFATYFGNLFFEQAVSVDDFRQRMEEDRQIYIRSSVTTQPVVHEEENLFDLLNRNNYEKGGWVLHMLRGRLGDEVFFLGIREFYRRYRHRAVLTEDFQALMEEISGQDLDWFFHQWLLEPGYPMLRISQEWVETSREIVLTVEQVQDAAWPTFRFQTEVEIELSSGTTRTPVEISARRSVIRIEAAERPRAVRFDPDGWVLKDIETP
jgi:aminopeptidase N